MELNICGKSEVGSSNINGDRFYISENRKLILLADGASGTGINGKVLMGDICVETLNDFQFDFKMSVEEYLDSLFWKINNKLIEESQSRRENIYGTLVIAMMHEGQISIASLGDSPTYFYDNNEIKEIARSPRKHEWMIKEGHISRKQYENYIASVHPWMWSSFNNFIPMIVPNHKIETISVKKDNIITICSDGVSDWISKEEIISTINDDQLESAIDRIIDIAKGRSINENNYFDDITIIGIKIN